MSLNIRNWCTPAYFYFIISVVAILIMTIQNYGNTNVYCLGDYTCGVTSTFLIFVVKVLYVLFWTWILNLLCKNGYESVSWFLFLLPYIIMFILIATIFFM
jgi:hypothetical protein